MNRTYTHRVTLPALAGIVLIAVLALYFFWQRGTLMVVAATLLTVLDVLAIERVIHTTYTLTADRLTISRGRFAGQQEIPLCDVRSATIHSVPFRLYKYVLIEYGERGVAAVMTENDDAFLKEIKKRIKNTENED